MPNRYQRQTPSTLYNKRYKFGEHMPEPGSVSQEPKINKLTEGHMTKGRLGNTKEDIDTVVSKTFELMDARKASQTRVKQEEAGERLESLDPIAEESERSRQEQIRKQQEIIHAQAVKAGDAVRIEKMSVEDTDDIIQIEKGPKFGIGLLVENARRDLGVVLESDGSVAPGLMNKLKAKLRASELRKIQEEIAPLYKQLTEETLKSTTELTRNFMRGGERIDAKHQQDARTIDAMNREFKAEEAAKKQDRDDMKKLGLGWYQRVVRPIALTFGLGGALGGGMKAGSDAVNEYVTLQKQTAAAAKEMGKLDTMPDMDSNGVVEFSVIPETEQLNMAEKKITVPKPLRFAVGQALPSLKGYEQVGEVQTYTVGDVDLHPEEVVTRQDITRKLKGSTLSKSIREKIYTQNGKEIGRAFILEGVNGAPDRTVFASADDTGNYTIDAVTTLDKKGEPTLVGKINPEMRAHFAKFGKTEISGDVAQNNPSK